MNSKTATFVSTALCALVAAQAANATTYAIFGANSNGPELDGTINSTPLSLDVVSGRYDSDRNRGRIQIDIDLSALGFGSAVITQDFILNNTSGFGHIINFSCGGDATSVSLCNSAGAAYSDHLIADNAPVAGGLNTLTLLAENLDPISLGVVFRPVSPGLSGNVVTSPVPAPAATWLFGSAIVGLASLKKRRHNI